MTTTYLPDAPLHQIRVHGNNPRRDLGDLTELTASITAKGILEPLVLAPINGVEWLLIAGHRRHAAAKAAGLTTAPALVHDDLDTPTKQLEAMLIENTQRTDLTPVEEAQAYQALLDFGSTIPKVAKATGRAVKTVKGRLALTKLPETTLARIHNGQISLEDANTLTEFAGTPEYAALVRDVGGSNFGWAVQRARENTHRSQAHETALAWARAHDDWTIAPSVGSDHERVASSWNPPVKMAEFLSTLTGPHTVTDGTIGGTWGIFTQATPTEPGDDADAGDSPAWRHKETPEGKVAREAREQLAADAQTAREVRATWLTARTRQLVLTTDERTAVLRLLLTEYAVNGWAAPESFALAGAPFPDDDPDGRPDEDAMPAWIAGLTENETWRALVAIAFDVTRSGSEHQTHDHVEAIQVAIALGYTPSPVEVQLLEQATP